MMPGILSGFSSYTPVKKMAARRSFKAVLDETDGTPYINQPLANPDAVIGQTLSDPAADISGNLMFHGTNEVYTGSYTVIPKTDSQVLRTTDKFLTDDITIEKIPFWETSNLSGGKTVYIAEDVIIS